uniref:Uncharacterized protein n=1 Tax=Myoviridae sp. cte0t5 TaxID=2823549 RepID=A0A8S5LHE3_9CAUD|nr:MAG TPA: hypothetical protein [Myoviridae sp. cte0t5]
MTATTCPLQGGLPSATLPVTLDMPTSLLRRTP